MSHIKDDTVIVEHIINDFHLEKMFEMVDNHINQGNKINYVRIPFNFQFAKDIIDKYPDISLKFNKSPYYEEMVYFKKYSKYKKKYLALKKKKNT